MCENLDDLWYLSQVICVGDVVTSRTQRRIKDKDDARSSGGERKTITVSVSVEKVEFSTQTNVLRVLGTIVSGPEDIVSLGSHHSVSVEEDSQITLSKPSWSHTDLAIVDDAVKSTLRPKVLIVSMDEGESVLALVRESRTDYIHIDSNVGGKYDTRGREERKKSHYVELTKAITSFIERESLSNIILSGPGFEKNNYLGYLKGGESDVFGKCVVEDTGSSGRNGVQEVLKKDAIHKALEDYNAVQNIRVLEEILREIGKDSGLAAYGPAEVRAAVASGAVETILVTDKFLFSNRRGVEPLLQNVRKARGRAHIISEDEEAGAKLHSLGGVAAKLRYKVY